MAEGGWSVYLLRCRDGSLYAGATCDLERRLAVHRSGKGARYTRARLPVVLAWSRGGLDRSGALRLEARIKRLPRAAKLTMVQGADPPG